MSHIIDLEKAQQIALETDPGAYPLDRASKLFFSWNILFCSKIRLTILIEEGKDISCVYIRASGCFLQ